MLSSVLSGGNDRLTAEKLHLQLSIVDFVRTYRNACKQCSEWRGRSGCVTCDELN